MSPSYRNLLSVTCVHGPCQVTANATSASQAARSTLAVCWFTWLESSTRRRIVARAGLPGWWLRVTRLTARPAGGCEFLCDEGFVAYSGREQPGQPRATCTLVGRSVQLEFLGQCVDPACVDHGDWCAPSSPPASPERIPRRSCPNPTSGMDRSVIV
jgi:hypothetical protein